MTFLFTLIALAHAEPLTCPDLTWGTTAANAIASLALVPVAGQPGVLRRTPTPALDGLAVAQVDYAFSDQGLVSCTWALQGEDAQLVAVAERLLGEPLGVVHSGEHSPRAVWALGRESAELWHEAEGGWRLSRSQLPAQIGILGVRATDHDLLKALLGTDNGEAPYVDIFSTEDAQKKGASN